MSDFIHSISALNKANRDFSGGRIAVVDIGSNSIRMVVYDRKKRSPVSIYNEKVMCGLGKGLAGSGKLNAEGVAQAKIALARFLALGKNMEIQELSVMATAAVRDASDGSEFVNFLQNKHNIKIDVISGAREARLGAYGVCSSIHNPAGITGDLGGGSLELVAVNNGEITKHASLPLGALRMVDETRGDRLKMRKIINSNIEKVKWLDEKKFAGFYAVGGSFRALAKIYMASTNYPLRILHEFTIDADDFLAFVRKLAAMSDEKLEKHPGVATKRIPQLPGAAMLIEAILPRIKAEQVVFSASGIREGYVYEMLPEEVKSEDGLISSCCELASRGGRTVAYGSDLYSWMSDIVGKESEQNRRLRLAFCLLSEIALPIHPEYRSEWAFDRVMFSALNCLTHSERVKLAVALYHRYKYKFDYFRPEMKLISESDKLWARLIGTAANLAYHLSGGISGNLHKIPLQFSSSGVSLNVSTAMSDLVGEAITRRLSGVNEAYEAYHDYLSSEKL